MNSLVLPLMKNRVVYFMNISVISVFGYEEISDFLRVKEIVFLRVKITSQRIIILFANLSSTVTAHANAYKMNTRTDN